jgi:hypothetical protein
VPEYGDRGVFKYDQVGSQGQSLGLFFRVVPHPAVGTPPTRKAVPCEFTGFTVQPAPRFPQVNTRGVLPTNRYGLAPSRNRLKADFGKPVWEVVLRS